MNDSQTKAPRVAENPEPPSSPAPVAMRGPSLWNRIRSLMARTTVSLRDDLQVALEESGSPETADFSESEKLILQNVLKLSKVSIDDVMVRLTPERWFSVDYAKL